MGQKVNPIGMRLGIVGTWQSRWYAGRGYAAQLQQDFVIREAITKKLKEGGLSSVQIERAARKVKVTVHTARPGMVIGPKGANIEALRASLKAKIGRDVTINIVEVRKPDLDARLVAEAVAGQLEKRVAFRRAIKEAVGKATRAGALGVKISCAGRLAGADIARTEWVREGRVPLHTLRAKIDYGTCNAATTYGIIGVKCWIYTGDADRLRQAPEVVPTVNVTDAAVTGQA